MYLLESFVGLGEVMVQLNPLTPGPLRHVKYFEVHVAGSEANMLIGLSRLGFRTGIVTKVGDDEFGKLILSTLRGEGVDVSNVKIEEEFPTGIYFIQRHYPIPGKSTVFYYRRGSAASTLSPSDLNLDYMLEFDTLIFTGITLALSKTCRESVEKSFKAFKSRGLNVVFDTNIRVKLWKDLSEVVEVFKKFLSSNIVFTNEEDLKILYPQTSFHEAARKILELGAELVVVKRGVRGAVAVTNEEVVEKRGFKVESVEDVIGAGDAFNAAFIASVARGRPLEEALEYANAAGSLVVTVRGDFEAFPSWADLETYLRSRKELVELR